MSVFIDSNFFIALLNTRDKHHKKAKDLLEQFTQPQWAPRWTSDYILDEVITTIWGHTHRKDLVKKAFSLIWEVPQFVNIHFLSKQQIKLAYEKFNTLAEWPKRPLSFTDCTSLAIIETLGLKYIVSFDAEFDGLVPKLT